MFTLLFFALTLACMVASVVASVSRPAEPLPVEAAIPGAALGLTWRRHRDVVTRNGARTLWLGEGDDGRFARAYKMCREVMRDAGYAWGTAEQGNGVLQPVCWEDIEMPEAARDYALAAAEEALAEDDERLAQEAARRGREAELDAALHGAARRADLEALRLSLRGWFWAWNPRKRAVAEALLAEPPGPAGAPRAGAAALARDLVAEVNVGIAATRARVAEHPEQDWLARAEDPVVRGDVLNGVRILSALDGDRASIRNKRGWGQAHTRMGHVLAGLESLTVIEATHALAAVHRHRRQLPPAMRFAIFGTEA